MTHHFFFFFFFFLMPYYPSDLNLGNHWVQILRHERWNTTCAMWPLPHPLFSGPTLSYVTVTCNLVPRASVTPVQRNEKTKTSGKIRLNSRFHWPLTERAQFHRKLINKQRTIILLPDFQYSMPREMDVQALGTTASRANMAFKHHR